MTTKKPIYSDLAIPPGEYLAEVLEELGINKKELARRMQRPASKLSAIFKGDKAITPETALQIENAIGVPAHIWLGLESEYRLTLARQADDAPQTEFYPTRPAFIDSMMSHGTMLRESTESYGSVQNLQSQLGVVLNLQYVNDERGNRVTVQIPVKEWTELINKLNVQPSANTNDLLSTYAYRGARAMVILHEQNLREFLDVWRQAKAQNIKLPDTSDTDYESLEMLLVHIFRAARGYMVWMCEKLDLPDPQIDSPPTPETVEVEADRYVSHLIGKWRTPLADVPENRFGEEYRARWGTTYCIDSMLEHAVLHPMRHTFQLRELLASQQEQS